MNTLVCQIAQFRELIRVGQAKLQAGRRQPQAQ